MIINWGDAPFKAFIKVTYPSGTCTVSNGTKTYTHTGGGTYTFTVNKKGTWTISATNGVDTKTATAEITSRGQTVTKSISYTAYFYKSGNQCTDVTGGWSLGTSANSVSFGSDSMVLSVTSQAKAGTVATKNKVDLSKIKTLYFKVNSTTSYSGAGYPTVGVANSRAVQNTPGGNGFAASTNLSAGTKTVSVDVSSISSAYIVVGGYKGDAGGTTITVYEVWGE